ncbi:MAG: type 4a pilus biogenesis protein PilO [Actinomycetota bacterium]
MNKRAPIFVLIAGAVIAILAVMFLVMPKRGEVSDAQDELVTAEQMEQELQLKLAQLEEARDAAPETNKEIRDIETLIPPTADEPGMILLLQSAADRAGVDPFTIAPALPTLSGDGRFSVISVSLDAQGSYFNLEEFLYNLETLPRAAKVISISVTASVASTDTTTTTTTTTTTPTENELGSQIVVEFYTTDLDAGPGSAPGPSDTPGAEGTG